MRHFVNSKRVTIKEWARFRDYGLYEVYFPDGLLFERIYNFPLTGVRQWIFLLGAVGRLEPGLRWEKPKTADKEEYFTVRTGTGGCRERNH